MGLQLRKPQHNNRVHPRHPRKPLSCMEVLEDRVVMSNSPMAMLHDPSDPGMMQHMGGMDHTGSGMNHAGSGMDHGGMGPHSDNPTLHNEHRAVMELVDYFDATYTAAKSGEWDDPATWEQGAVPGTEPENEARVVIPEEFTVTVDAVQQERIQTIRVDGVLAFDPTVNTQLMVDTIVIDPRGTFQMGSEAAPIAADVEARVIITDDGPIDASWDPGVFSRGILSHGTFRIYGDATTSFVALAEAPTKRSNVLNLAEIPNGWEAGDRLVLTGTSAWNRNDDEQFAILAIDGNKVTLDRQLAHNHIPPEGMQVFVANVSRNAIIESENPFDVDRRGHIMIMHNPDAVVQYAGLYGLGRTDKRNPVHNAILDEDGKRIDGTGLNQVGRYVLHFHRARDHHMGMHSKPAEVIGTAVVDSPGWGFVNHSSHVVMEDNVAYDVLGAAFVTEAGDEIGAFRRNIAIRSEGSGDGIESRKDRGDFGHQGDGFWFQGANVEVEGNIAVGQRHAGFVYFTQGLDEAGLGVARIKTHDLVDPSMANGKDSISVADVPIRLFKDNVAFANGTGFETWKHLLGAKHQVRSVVDGLVVWGNRGNGVHNPYTRNLTLKDATILRNTSRPGSTGINRNNVTNNITYENVRVEGFKDGIKVPTKGHNKIVGGYFNNVRSIVISTTRDERRVVDIEGEIHFGNMSQQALRGKTQHQIYLQKNFNLEKVKDINLLFSPDLIRLGTVKYQGKQVYYLEQAADVVPFPAGEAADYIPEEFIGKTNQQLWNEFGLAVGGAIAPQDAITDPAIRGLIGDPASYLPEFKLRSRKFTNQLDGYRLVYQTPDGARVREQETINLREGWNVITRQIDGQTRTFLVYGDVTGPTLNLKDPITEINPIDLKRGFTLKGKLSDDSFGAKNFKKKFKNLDQMPVQTRDDGTKYLVLEFDVKDLAGNVTKIRHELTIDSNAPLVQDRGFRRDLPKRELSETLLSLIGFIQTDDPNDND